MSQFEYKVVPAPKKGRKTRGVRGTEARFANALEAIMNEQAEDGWQYLRTDTLPCEERQGLAGRVTTYQNVMVFRRALHVEATPEPDLPVLPLVEPKPAPIERPVERPAKVIAEDLRAVFKGKGEDELDVPALGGVTKTDP